MTSRKPCITLKFGGTSVGTIDRIKVVAQIIRDRILEGNRVAVVVSAMSGATNKILGMCADIRGEDSADLSRDRAYEIDAALSTGETLSASLLALALMDIGIPARSLQAWQAGVISSDNPNNALIESVDPSSIITLLDQDIVPVITGFQAISSDGRTTTIGRGGSDTSAAIIAAATSSEFCDIYTDVEGIYTCDPRLIQEAKIIPEISYEEAIELAGTGAKVLHPRCVEICMRYKINLRVCSSFNQQTGTIIMNHESVNETHKITGISYYKDLAIVKVDGVSGNLANLLSELHEAGINIQQMINFSNESLVFAIKSEFLGNVIKSLDKGIDRGNYNYSYIPEVASLTLVGAALRHDLDITLKILSVFNELDREVLFLTHSEIKLTIFFDQKSLETATRALHKTFIEND